MNLQTTAQPSAPSETDSQTVSVATRFTPEDLRKQPGEGERTATDMVIMARARDMGGDFSVMEGVIKPHELLAPHSHKFEDQLVYVISGELVFEIGGENGIQFTASAGSYVQKPRGIVHGFWNPTDTPAHYIELSGQHRFEGFVDSTQRGHLYSTVNAERDWGMVFSLEDIPRLMRTHNLIGLSMTDSAQFPNFPDLPEFLKQELQKLKIGK